MIFQPFPIVLSSSGDASCRFSPVSHARAAQGRGKAPAGRGQVDVGRVQAPNGGDRLAIAARRMRPTAGGGDKAQTAGWVPRLVGDISASRLRVAMRPRNRRSQPWFEGVINPAPNGGTIVRGTVGLPSSSLVTMRAFSVVVAFVVVVMAAAGLESAVPARVLARPWCWSRGSSRRSTCSPTGSSGGRPRLRWNS